MLLSSRCLAYRAFLTAGLTIGAAMISPARADDAAPAAPPASAPAADASNQAATDAQIAQWVKELDSDLFATRQSAAQKLYEAGTPAIKPVTEATGSPSLEVSSQAIEILRRMLHSDQTPLHEAAKHALEDLAKGDNAAASRAREALAPPPAPQQGQIPGVPFGAGGIIVPGGGQIQIGIGINGGNIQVAPGGGAQVIRMRTQVANGVTKIEVEENGKKIKIEKDPNNGIEINVTEKVNGQDKTDTYKAKDADELKKKSPEAYKLYEKYGQAGGGAFGNVQIRAIQAGAMPVPFGAPGGIQMRAFPQGLPNMNPQQGAAEKEAAKQVEEARKLVADATDGLKQVVQGAEAEAARQKALGQLEDALNKLDSAEQKLKR